MQDTLLSLQHISKNFGEGDVLRDISLDVARGEFVTLLGASGCGKTTLTRLLNGLIPHYHEGTFTGSVQGITFYNDVALEKNVVDSFSGYTKTTGNVLNTFYGATTTMISNESSFDKE